MKIELDSAEWQLLKEVLEDHIDAINQDLVDPEDVPEDEDQAEKDWQEELRERLETAEGLLQRILTA